MNNFATTILKAVIIIQNERKARDAHDSVNNIKRTNLISGNRVCSPYANICGVNDGVPTHQPT